MPSMSKAVAKSCGAEILERPQEMVHYHSGFYTTESWKRSVNMQIVDRVGEPDITAFLNCNHILLSSRTIDKMFHLILDTPDVTQVLAVTDVAPGIVIKNEVSGFVFPLFPSLKGIIRKVGVSLNRNTGTKTKFFNINWEESRDIQNKADIPFAEFRLKQKETYGVDSDISVPETSYLS